MANYLLAAAIIENTKNKDEIKRITENTIDGKDLRISDVELLSKVMNFEQDEKVLYLYCYSGKFEPRIVLEGNVFIGITNKRVFKIEKGGSFSVMRKNILSAKHIKNGIFSWDRIEFDLIGGKKDSFGIYHNATCEYFTNYINCNIMSAIR